MSWILRPEGQVFSTAPGPPRAHVRPAGTPSPVGRLGQMASHGADGFGMALAPGDALIEAADVAARPARAVDADRVGRFDERPLEIPVHVGAERAEAGLAAAGMDPRRGPGIAGELLGSGEAADVAHFEGNDDGEDEAHAGQRHKELDPWGRGEHGLHALLELVDPLRQALDL